MLEQMLETSCLCVEIEQMKDIYTFLDDTG
jgi:hypothetical protein